MRKLVIAITVAALAIWASPERVVQLSLGFDTAEAKRGGRAGGYKARPHRPPSGAKTRPRPQTRPAARPSSRPATRPATRPSTRPATRPSNRPSTRPATRPNRPEVGNRPGARPPGSRPPATRPPKPVPPIAGRPPGTRPPVARPPVARPPGGRPPGWRPPGWRPPHHRPPSWRPPPYRPPYYRPPHYYWGTYYYYPRWGWYFTATVASATLVYILTLPRDQECEKIEMQDETLYVCDGVLYRPVYYKDELVYEIVSDAE